MATYVNNGTATGSPATVTLLVGLKVVVLRVTNTGDTNVLLLACSGTGNEDDSIEPGDTAYYYDDGGISKFTVTAAASTTTYTSGPARV